MDGSAWRFSIEDEERMPGGELAMGGWAHPEAGSLPSDRETHRRKMILNLMN
jgi:hypothetical protein